MDNCLKYFLFIITVKKPQNGLKFREIVANSSLIIPHIILLQFVLILGAVTPKNSSCPNLLFTIELRCISTRLFLWTVECTLNDSTCLLIFEKSGQNAQKCAILTNVLNKMYYYKIVHAKYIFKIC